MVVTLVRATGLTVAAAASAGCAHAHTVPLARCGGPYPTGRDLQLSPNESGRAVRAHIGDVLSVGNPDPTHHPTASGDAALCLFGSGEADGPPGTPPSSWISYAVIRRGVEQLQITPAAGSSYTVTIRAGP